MADAPKPVAARKFGKRDFKRALTNVAFLALACGYYWFVLPRVQWFIIPHLPGGTDGPWLVRPDLAFRFGAMAVLSALTLPLATYRLRKKWREDDAAAGTQFRPFSGKPAVKGVHYVQGILLMVIYGVALMFYLLSWTIVNRDGVDLRLPWTKLHYSFEDVAALEFIPEGERNDSPPQEGPWYAIHFRDERQLDFSLGNEGMKQEELEAIAKSVAERTGLTWVKRKGTYARKRE